MRRRLEIELFFLVAVFAGATQLAAQQAVAKFIYPVNGQSGVDSSQPFRWATVPGGLGYYVWIGTSVGTSNLANSGALQTTSYHVPSLPANQTLYARLWTQTSIGWVLYSDIAFTVAQGKATFLYPVNGQQNVDISAAFQWTAVPGGLGYYLWVGTSVGTSNLVNSGAQQTTSYQVPALPTDQTLYARLWTETSAGWTLYQDIAFALALSQQATFIYPMDGQRNVSGRIPVQWTSASGGLGYQLYVGTSAGASDLVNSGALQTTSYQVPWLPTDQTLYARIWTETSAGWQFYQDITFTVPALPFLWPRLYGQAGAYGVQTPEEVAAIANNGFHLVLVPYQGILGKLAAALTQNDVQYLDPYAWGQIRAICQTAPSCVLSDAQQQRILNDVQAHLESTSDDSTIIGYWILDDYPHGDIHVLLQKIHDLIATANQTSVFPRPAVCGFGGSLGLVTTPAVSTRYFDMSLVNFSPSACDMVALYPYATGEPDDPVDWSMSNLLPAMLQHLQARGWDGRKQPLIGMPQTFGFTANGHYYVRPTTADVITQSTAYCAAGAIALLAYTWDDSRSEPKSELYNSPDLVAGLQQGASNCGW